ncbi:unnamed protein product [Choristocarpus tenellus]
MLNLIKSTVMRSSVRRVSFYPPIDTHLRKNLLVGEEFPLFIVSGVYLKIEGKVETCLELVFPFPVVYAVNWNPLCPAPFLCMFQALQQNNVINILHCILPL